MTISISLPAEDRIGLSTQNHGCTSLKSAFMPKSHLQTLNRVCPKTDPWEVYGFSPFMPILFLQLSPYSFPLSLHVCCLSIFILIFILLGVMTVHLPPDQICYWSLCISSTVPSPKICVIFPKKDNTQCIPFPTPLACFPLGTCCAGCWFDSGGPEVVPEGLLTGCRCSVQPCHLCRAGARDSNVKNIWWGLWEILRTVCVSCTAKSCMLLRSGLQLCIFLLGFPSLLSTLQLPAY